jgi:thiamine biosynthesis lipoprotein
MSTLATVTLIARGAGEAVVASEAAFAALDSVNTLMSFYNEESDLARVNRSAGEQPVRVDEATFAVLERAREFWERSGGAFDASVGPLITLWKRCAKAGRLPEADEIATARARIGFDKIRLDPKTQGVQFGAPGMSIDLGGIAKGYAIDRAVSAILRAGVEAGIVEVGGDLRCFGRIPAGLIGRSADLPVRTLRRRDRSAATDAPGNATSADSPAAAGTPGSARSTNSAPEDFFPGMRHSRPAPLEDLRAWPLGVQSPFGEALLGKIRVPAGAVATSGHYRRYTTIAGKRYSHIIDPRTGRPVEAPTSVTVIAADALTADALATAITVLGAGEGLALAESIPGVEALVIEGDADTPVFLKTANFPEVEALGQRQ